jgi:hypothetical protein
LARVEQKGETSRVERAKFRRNLYRNILIHRIMPQFKFLEYKVAQF